MSEEELYSRQSSSSKDKKSRYEDDINKNREFVSNSARGYYQSKQSFENFSNRQYKDENKDLHDRYNSPDANLYKNNKNEFYRKNNVGDYRNSFYDGVKNPPSERGGYAEISRKAPQDLKQSNSSYPHRSESYESRNGYYDRNSSVDSGRYYSDAYKQTDYGRYGDINDHGAKFYDSGRRQSSYDDTYKRYRLDTRYPTDGYTRPSKSRHIPAGPNNTIGVFGFNPNTTDDDLRSLLNSLLPDRFEYTSKLIMDERTGLCKGFCFIDFKCLDHAIAAKNILSKESFRGQDFKCDYSYKQGILGLQD